MDAIELRIPGDLTDTMVLARWLVTDGDRVKVDDPMCEMETEKASIELAASHAGRLEHVAAAMRPLQPGQLICRIWPTLAVGILLLSCPPREGGAAAGHFDDPAPPVVASLEKVDSPLARENPEVKFHAAPRPLPAEAVTEDWPCFLGLRHNLTSIETKLIARFPAEGPSIVWEAKRGTGYAAPAILGERLVCFHRMGGNEVVDCLQSTTGKRFWRFEYPTEYLDRYGFCDGPRASPVIAGESVFTIGAEGKLHCLELSTGRVRWRRDLLSEFGLLQNFFGVGSTPLVEGDRLIVNVGATKGPCVAAFDVNTGKMIWGAGDKWGPSYASPIPADVQGKRRVFVFAGGETGPREKASGGLLCIDPANGAVDFTFPWRGTRRESVNASSPLIVGNQVFISECYGSGGALLDIQPDMTSKPAWKNRQFGTHFMTAIEKDGHLYGVDGHGPEDAFLVCVERSSGKEIWRRQPEWKEAYGARERIMGTYRSHIMPVDGRYLCLGEFGHLLWMDLNPQGYKILDRATLFSASETWTPPVLSRGLLYVAQNTEDRVHDQGMRLICYDLRAEK